MFTQNKELYYKQLQRDLDAAIGKDNKKAAIDNLFEVKATKGVKVDFETLEDVTAELKGEGYFVDRLKRERELDIEHSK